MNRVKYFDSLRLLAIFVVFLTHFVDAYYPEYFALWETFPTSLLLSGISGKLGVALFGVILGYFAYLSKEENATYYILKRFSFFVISALLINTLYALAGVFLDGYRQYSLFRVIIESITIDDDIFPTYWCIPAFFVASIISFLNGKAKLGSLGIIMEILLFYKLQYIWIAVCLMGNLIAKYSCNQGFDILKHRAVRIACWVVFFFAIKRPESNTTYMIDGICCTLMIILIMRGTVVQTILNNHFMAAIGKQGMGIYILHPLCYAVIAPTIFNALSFAPYSGAFVSAMIICFVITVLLAFPAMYVINKGTNYAGKLLLYADRLMGTINNG